MGLYTPTILGGNSYLSWFYDRGTIKDPAHTGTSKGLSQAIDRGPIKKFMPKYANVYVTIQSHGLSAGVRAHYVTDNGVRNGLRQCVTFYEHEAYLLTPCCCIRLLRNTVHLNTTLHSSFHLFPAVFQAHRHQLYASSCVHGKSHPSSCGPGV